MLLQLQSAVTVSW